MSYLKLKASSTATATDKAYYQPYKMRSHKNWSNKYSVTDDKIMTVPWPN